MASLTVKANFLKSIQPKQLMEDVLWGAGAAIPYSLVPSLLAKATDSKFDGWKGFFTAVISTWGVGAMFDIPQFRSGAWTLGMQHLIYAYDLLGKANIEIWRFDDGTLGNGRSASAPGSGLPSGTRPRQGVNDNAAMMQPGAALMTFPDGSQIVGYPDSDPTALQEPVETYAGNGNGMSDFYMQGQAPGQMRNVYEYDQLAF
jgi:hypothetical protein